MLALPTPAMILICGYLLKEGLPLLQGSPLLLPLAEEIRKLREMLLGARKEAVPPLPPEEEKKVRQKLRRLDKEHDLLNWLIVSCIKTALRWNPSETYQAVLEATLKNLYQDGLTINRMKWSEEAGEALQLGKQLEQPELCDLLAKISFTCETGTFTLLECATRLVQIGEEMETLLNRISGLDKTTLPSQDRLARLHFFKIMKSLIATAEVAYANQPEKLKTLFKKLDEQIDLYKEDQEDQEEPPQPPPPTPTNP